MSWKILDTETGIPMITMSSHPITSEKWHVFMMRDIIYSYMGSRSCNLAIDIGASYGFFTVPFAKYFDNVVAFEPQPDVFECLKQNATQSNVKLHNIALSNIDSVQCMNKPTDTGHAQIVDDGEVIVHTNKLDSVFYGNVDLIKIDVEGHELYTLLGALQTLRRSKPVLIIEMDTRRGPEAIRHREPIFNLLFDIGYKVVDVRQQDIVFRCEE